MEHMIIQSLEVRQMRYHCMKEDLWSILVVKNLLVECRQYLGVLYNQLFIKLLPSHNGQNWILFRNDFHSPSTVIYQRYLPKMIIRFQSPYVLKSPCFVNSLLNTALTFGDEVHFITFASIINNQILRLCEFSVQLPDHVIDDLLLLILVILQKRSKDLIAYYHLGVNVRADHESERRRYHF